MAHEPRTPGILGINSTSLDAFAASVRTPASGNASVIIQQAHDIVHLFLHGRLAADVAKTLLICSVVVGLHEDDIPLR